ncbi:hypothetical protein [Paludisphaera sp.]|uniref:hypothetical protein n=1 Tax=Paludisphaera sp. TaxID=2017432 RepID=UPI00301DF702
MRRLTSLAAAVAFGILLTFAGADANAQGWGGYGPGRGHHPHGGHGPGRGHHPHGGWGPGRGWVGHGPGYGHGRGHGWGGYGPGYGRGGRGPFPPPRVYAVPTIYLGSPVGYIITYGGVRYRVIGGGSMVIY